VALIIPPHVARQFATMPRADARRLRERLDRIAVDPSGPQPGVKAMAGMPGTFRVRQGDWRAIYTIKDGNVIVGHVGNRKEVYR
jgi:mRNA interferase RelE/StbE